MLKHKLFGNNIDCSCEYCDNSNIEDEECICKLGRKIDAGGRCKKFRYDPLRRSPHRKPKLPEYDPSEFSI